MPLGEATANAVVVKIDGSPLAPNMRDLLVSAYVDDSVHLPGLFVLRFSDPEHDVLPGIRAKIGSQVSVAVQQSGQGTPVELIDGDITALEEEIDSRGVFTTIRGLDVRYRLQSGAGATAYANMSVTDIVTRTIQEAGLQSQVGSFTTQHAHLAKDMESSWDFLCRLARGVGALTWVTGRTVHFAAPPAAATATSGTDAGTDPKVIQRGTNLISLRATVTGSGQVPKVEARGWDPRQKQATTAAGQVRTASVAIQPAPAVLASALGGTGHVVGRSTLALAATTRKLAETTAAVRAGGYAEIEGVVRGNPVLRAGTPVNVVEVGPSFSGKYVLTAVRHEIDPVDGYRTTFTAADFSDRSVYGLISGGGAVGPGSDQPHRSVLTAVVTNVKDPDGLGRVKVKFPVFSDEYESWWARPVQLGAGNGRGTSWLPEVNDEVLVAFGQGSFDEPYVLGGLYNGLDKAGKGWAAHVNSDGTVKRRAFTSRNGMVLEFIEDGQQDTLTVATNNGAQHLTLTQTGSKGIVLVSQGPLDVTAEQNITVTGKQNISMSTSTGDFSVKAVNVSIEATAKASVKGAQVVAEGQATAEVKAATVKINGQATAELAASGITTVRGAMVKIN